MNFLINNVVGIKFKPKDDNVGIPVPILETIQNKTVAENLGDGEFDSLLKENNIDKKDLLGMRTILTKRLREKNGCMIEYEFTYIDGWYRLQKFNCERVQSEIEYITEFVRNACAPIEIIIQEAE